MDSWRVTWRKEEKGWGCGTVGSAVDIPYMGPQLESSHWRHNISAERDLLLIVEMTKKEAGQFSVTRIKARDSLIDF